MIQLLLDYEKCTPQMKENMGNALKSLGVTMTFREYARKNYESARMGLNSIIQMGDYKLKIVATEEEVPYDTAKEVLKIDPNFNPNEK